MAISLNAAIVVGLTVLLATGAHEEILDNQLWPSSMFGEAQTKRIMRLFPEGVLRMHWYVPSSLGRPSAFARWNFSLKSLIVLMRWSGW